jgi:site-specific DNA recombinase
LAKKAALYLRSSKDRHDVSVESQRRELNNFALQRGDIVVAEFIDKVESAKTDDRPGFQAMVAEAKTRECRFDVVYCFDTSRFSRRQYHAQMYKHLLKKHNIELSFLKLPKTDTILDPIIESLMEAFDEFHSQKSKMDGLRGMAENIRQGWRAGGRPILGYQLERHIVGMRDGNPITKSKLIPDAKLFHRIQAYLKGRALGEPRQALAEKLNLEVNYSTLAYIEESALTYAGHTVWNRHSEYVDGRYTGGKKFRDSKEWVITHNTHEAMITEEEAESILQHLTQQRRKKRRNRKSTYLLSGIVHCSCGAHLEGNAGFYRCHDRCGKRSIKQDTLEHAVLDALYTEIITPENLLKLQQEVKQQIGTQHTNHDHCAAALENELKDITRQINDIVQLITQVKHQRPLLERIDVLEESRLKVKEQLDAEQLVSNPPILDASLDLINEFIASYRENLQSGESYAKKAVIQSVIDRGVFDGENLEIYPGYNQIAGGVKMASPRGFEPLLPP